MSRVNRGVTPNAQWRNDNYKKPKNYKGIYYRKAGDRLNPEIYNQKYENTLQAVEDAFGERYAISGDGNTINIGTALEMPGMSNDQYAISQLLKRRKEESDDVYGRMYELTPSSLNKTLVEAAQLGIIDKSSINRIIGGGGVQTAAWDDAVLQAKFGQTGQEMASGIDVLTGGPVYTDAYDMGHIYASKPHPHKKHMPRNTRVESKHENRGYQDFEGEALLSVIDNRLKDTAIAIGREKASREQIADIENRNVRGPQARINQAGVDREFRDIGQERVNELDSILSAQMVIDSMPPEQRTKAMLALGMVTPDQVL